MAGTLKRELQLLLHFDIEIHQPAALRGEARVGDSAGRGAGSGVGRAVGLYLLLAAMGMSLSFPLAIGFLCASAAASALPIAPAAGAAAQAGGGAALLIASGVPTNTAVGFAISAQALVIFGGIAVLVVAMFAHGAERLLARRARLAAL